MNNQNNFFLSTYLDKNTDLLLNNLLEKAVISVKNSLQKFATEPDFTDKMQLAFGKNADGSYLRNSWEIGDFIFPQIEVVNATDINGANGAYAKQNNKIYLAQEFLLANQSDIDVIAAVLLEEYGHYLDSELNLVDSPGDEGAIFSALVRRETFTETELQNLKLENDLGTVVLNNQAIEIEMALETTDLKTLTSEDLANRLLGEGITISDVRFSGSLEAAGSFTGADIGIFSGIILSSGSIANPGDDNNSFNLPGDPNLDAIVSPSSTEDAAILEIDFIPEQDQISFSYVFASQEYDKYVGREFNDVFGFFLNGKNIALIPGTSTPVAINNVNAGNRDDNIPATNPQFFNNNTTNTGYNGLTKVFTAKAIVTPNIVQTLKLAIADNSDGIFDSAVFIEENSFASSDCSDTSPLKIEVAGGTFEDKDGDGDCDAQGTIYIGRDDGIGRMLRVEGATAEHDENSLTLTGGTVYSEISNVTEALFEIDGSLEIPFSDPTATVSEVDGLDNQFQLAGLDISVKSLNLQPNQFRLGGNFTLPEKITGKQLDIPLNIPNAIIFKQNEVSLGADVSKAFPDKEFKLLNLLEVETEEVSISYEALTDTIKIHGKLELESLVKSFDPELTVDLTEPNLIQIKDGKVDGIVTLAVEDIKPRKGWEIDASITLDTIEDELTGRGSIVFPFSSKSTKGKKKKGGLDLELGFKTKPSTQLDSIAGKVTLPGIPVGTTGFFLNEINGGLNNLAPSNNQLVEFTGGVKLTGGRKPLKLIDLNLEATINAEQATGRGTISIIDPAIIQGTTQATLNWNAETFSARNNVSIFGGLLEGTTSFNTDSSFNFVMGGTATLNVPFFIPFIGGEEIAGTELLLKFSNDDNLANDFVRASASISNPLGSITGQQGTITVGIKQSLDGGLPEFLGSEVPITGSWDVVPDTSYLLVSANWENPTDADTPIQVIDNNGNVIAEEDFAAKNIAVVEDLTDENTKTVIIANPEAGRWDVELVSTEGLGEVTYFATRDSDAPTIEIIEPSQTVPGGEVEIVFDAFDADSEANISLFYDDDGEGFDGIQIVDGLIEQDGRGKYTWNTAGVATGEYHIYAMALDDTNAPVFSYSPGTVQITEAADLSVSQTVDLESVDLGEEQTYTVIVTNNGEDDSQGVNLTYILPEGATFVSATVNPSEQTDNNLTFDLGDLANGETSNIEITVNASNIVGDNVSNAVVNSNTYDPDFINDAASLTTTVTNNQSLPEFSISDVSVAEGNGNKIDAVFTVSVSEALEETIKVDYATEDYTAIASEDYISNNGTLEFAPGETEKTITVEVIGDTDFEQDETFFVNLSNPVNSAIATPFGTGTIQNDDTPPPLQVSDIQVSSNSLSIELNNDINLDLLNLYRGENNRNALSDLTLVGEKTGTVKGSLVWNNFTQTLTFIKTTGILEPDKYTLTIPSKEDGIVTSDGGIIDGNSDGIGGDDYTFQFTIEETSDRILSIPDLILAPAETTNIPITLDNVEGVTKLEFDLNYDTELLDVTAVNLNDSLPSDWQLSENTIDRDNGIINVTIEGTDSLTGNNLNMVNLATAIPDSASYGDIQILDLANVVLNDGTVAAIDDDGLHQVIKAGDVTGNSSLSGLDAYQMMRVSVGLNDGFDRFSTIDPVIIADLNGDRLISGLDAYYVVNN